MKKIRRSIFFLTVLICGTASLTANATTWDFEGVVHQCEAIICDLAGITVGVPVAGFITADDVASSPGSTFTAEDILDYGVVAEGLAASPVNSAIVSAAVTTDALGELIAGTIVFSGVADGGTLGDIELSVTADVATGAWIVEADFAVVASGSGQWSLEADGDGLAAIQDNCTEVANPAQRDTDADGIGNFCDADFDQDCIVNFIDLGVMSANFFVPGDFDTDLDGSGLTNFNDLGIMSGYFFAAPGPSGIPNVCTGTGEPDIASVELITNSPQIPSDGSMPATITAFVRDSNNNFVVGVDVVFSATSGGLTVTQATTDANGTAIAILATAGDPTNRIITVTATSGTVSETIDISVTGTQLDISGPDSLVFGDTATYTIVLGDSAGMGIAGEAITVSSTAGNTLSETTLVTDVFGQAQVDLTATIAGTDTLTASGLGITASLVLSVSNDSFVFNTPPANAEIPLNTDQVFRVTWLQGGLPQVGESISFATTRGVFVGPATDITDGSGQASVTIRSSNAGPAIVIADAATGPATQLQVEFIATIPASLEMQADPVTVAPNGLSTITATVRDVDNNPAKNIRVIFMLHDFTGGALSVGSADTDSQGRAQTIYSASDTLSGNMAVTVTGYVEFDPTITDFVNLTVAQDELFISLGTSNDLTEPDPATYQMPFLAIVTDAEGNGVAGVTVQFDVKSTRYSKGYWGDTGAAFWAPISRAVCLDEDQNGNGILDPGEIDENSNGTIEAGNVVAIDSNNPITDANGTASINLLYAKLYGAWTEVRVEALISIAGTEYSRDATFVLPVLADDIAIEGAPPGLLQPPDPDELGFNDPFVSSPWGYGDSCAENF